MARPRIYPTGRKLAPNICAQCKNEYFARADYVINGKSKFCCAKCKYDNKKIDPIKRFWNKVQKTDTCWNWLGFTRNGYGSFWHNNKNERAHRFSYFLHLGEIPNDLNVCHSCDNPTCVNPHHLFIGTTQDNVDDKMKKGRGCFGSKNGFSKLTENDVIKIKKMYAEKESIRKIADSFKVSYCTIWDITSIRAWKHVV